MNNQCHGIGELGFGEMGRTKMANLPLLALEFVDLAPKILRGLGGGRLQQRRHGSDAERRVERVELLLQLHDCWDMEFNK